MNSSQSTVNIWYLTRYLKEYRWHVVFTLLFLVAGRVAASLDPVWLKQIIDGVGEGKTLAALTSVLIVYFGLKALTFVLDCLRDIIFAPAEMGIARTLSQELFTHLLTLPVGYHFEQKIGGLSRQITRGGRAVTFILDFMVINILPTIIELVVVAFLLLRLYPPIYAIITVATVVAYTWFTIWTTEKRQKFRLGANQADDEVAGIEVDALSNIETVKYFNNEDELQHRYRPAIDKRYELNVASNKLFALISSGQAAILLVGLGWLLFLAIRQTLSGTLTIGDLVLLTTYIMRLSAPIGVLGFVYRAIKDGLADLDAMAKILCEEVTVSEPVHPVTLPGCQGAVSFDHVGFGYSDERIIFQDISFAVQPGERIAFVGPSGVGKSTIVKLLFRFFDPTKGRILIDGVDVRDLDKRTRRSLFAIVPQEPALFNTTIAENIRFGKPDATQAEIEKAAQLAGIAHFIEGLPDQYQTLVGERGVKLSGGEKQRVAIARAIIREPAILVFDEATSSLDSSTEKQIQKSLDAIAQGRTTIAVAHRLSTIADSDMIYVLDRGQIVERGTHQQLLERNGLYARLWRIQAEGDNAADEDRDVLIEADGVPAMAV
ncbi:MAG: ATP-binding cassette domain-containing protein [Armatimonadota bacterium]|nr:ATP-binding cassette domain-containing protein [Armatimonadota bacterium]